MGTMVLSFKMKILSSDCLLGQVSGCGPINNEGMEQSHLVLPLQSRWSVAVPADPRFWAGLLTPRLLPTFPSTELVAQDSAYLTAKASGPVSS